MVEKKPAPEGGSSGRRLTPSDLLSKNQFIAGLSLSTISNIGSAGIAQDVAADVEKLMASPSNYIKKKAAAARIAAEQKKQLASEPEDSAESEKEV